MMHISELSAQMPELHWCHFSMCSVERKSSIFITAIIRGAKWTHCFWHLFIWLNLKFHAGKKKILHTSMLGIKNFFWYTFPPPSFQITVLWGAAMRLGHSGGSYGEWDRFCLLSSDKTQSCSYAHTHTVCNKMLQISVLSAGLGMNNMI